MRGSILLVLLTMSLVPAGPRPAAAVFTAAQLELWCSPENDPPRETCDAYLTGVVESHLITANKAADEHKIDVRMFCPPVRGIDTGDIRRIWLDWLHAHAGAARMLASATVFIALGARYPCKNPRIRWPGE